MLRRNPAGPCLLALVSLSAACVTRPPSTPPAAPAAATAPASDAGAFVVMLGADTVAVERFTRTAATLEGDIVVRVPMTRVIHYSASLAPDGTIRSFESAVRPGAAMDGPAMQQATVTITGDSARITTSGGANAGTATIAVRPGALPIPAVLYAMFEQGALQHRRSGRDSTETDLILVGGRQATSVAFVRRGADSLHIHFRGSPLAASVDQFGRLTGIDGIRTTEKVLVRRVPSVDFTAVVASFVSRDQGGRAMGQLSPRDTVTAAVGAATVTVEYSRPARRGRQIFGSVVPWNQVWRTGANAATTLTTSADLTIGGTAVPAGKYTLFTLPTPSGTTLIINSQTGQWGTAYDPARDFARVALTPETLAEPVEVFTIEIVPAGAGSRLLFAWDRTRLSVPIAAR